MSILADALEWLNRHNKTYADRATVTTEGKLFSVDPMTRVERPKMAPALELLTLRGFVEACAELAEIHLDPGKARRSLRDDAERENPPKNLVVTCSYDEVQLVTLEPDPRYDERVKLIRTQVPPPHNVAEWMSPEAFIIQAGVRLVPGEELDRLLKKVGSITDKSEMQTSDDGITQRVSVQSGVQLAWADIQNPFELSTWRTFPELTQPTTPHMLRVRGGNGQAVTLSLFEVADPAWKGVAAQAAAAYLRDTGISFRVVG